MDASDNLSLTPKGIEELQRRTYKLNIKKRSVLILLEKQHTVEQFLERTIYPRNEIIAELNALIHEGFVHATGDHGPAAPITAPTANVGAPVANLHIDDEIVLSEAKFLLADFSMDSFGAQSKILADEIRACRDVDGIRQQVRKIFSLTEEHSPERLPELLKLIKDINDTT